MTSCVIISKGCDFNFLYYLDKDFHGGYVSCSAVKSR
jgi:hypothetical protein